MNHLFFVSLIFFIFLYFRKCLSNNLHRSRRIYNGHETTVSDVPYQAVISLANDSIDSPLCGGAIISEDVVITAASCLINFATQRSEYFETKDLRVTVGITHLSNIDEHTISYKVSEIIPYCKFKFHIRVEEHNIALVIIDGSIEMSSDVQALEPNTKPIDAHTFCTISGYGETDTNKNMSKHLQIGYVQIAEDWECIPLIRKSLIKSQICITRQADACPGDLGGPLQCMDKLVGIITRPPCGSVRWSIYTRVSSYIDFINNRGCENKGVVKTTTNWFCIILMGVLYVSLF